MRASSSSYHSTSCCRLWWLDAGFVSDVSWDIALLYGFGASLVANGVADTGLVQWVIGLFRKKREEAE